MVTEKEDKKKRELRVKFRQSHLLESLCVVKLIAAVHSLKKKFARKTDERRHARKSYRKSLKAKDREKVWLKKTNTAYIE
jgi:hypothetical protein